MAAKQQGCSVCFRNTKYVCIKCKMHICNVCGETELDEDVKGWIAGRQVGYCHPCSTKKNMNRKFDQGNHEDDQYAASAR